MAGPVEIEWSLDAVADLDRFAAFLHNGFPISRRISRTNLWRGLTFSGDIRRWVERSAGREEYRELLLQVLGGTYALQYRYDGRSILMLRIYHGREAR